MTVYLADTSAWAVANDDLITDLIAKGSLATCQIVELELLYSARNMRHYTKTEDDLAALRRLDVTTEVMDHTLWLQRTLAEQGKHRLPVKDLIIAATAELGGATVLHNDRDFDTIASVTKLRVQNVLELIGES